MRLMVCLVDENPCQGVNQATIALTDVLEPSLYGITSDGILRVIEWGFGFVLFSFLLGYVVSLAVGLVKKV